MQEIFRHGSAWLRADFVLHTRTNVGFQYDAPEGGDADVEAAFIENYVGALKTAGIRTGVVANRNILNLGEFRALRDRALAEEIFLLPGVELLLNEGENGVRVIVVFSEDWIRASDYVSSFLDVTLLEKSPDASTGEGLLDLIELLEEYRRDFFIVFPDVEELSGLWRETDGETLARYMRHGLFQRRAAAFTGVRNEERRKNLKEIPDSRYPAEVQGSHPSRIEEIGRNEACYIKIGAFTFEAVRYALVEQGDRVDSKPREHEASWIESVVFEGGMLDGVSLSFASELNALIGIRGSGKSAILEILRYALDIPCSDRAPDKEYKGRLVEYVLGSGGKVTIRARDREGNPYELSRILREVPDVYIAGVLQPGVSIRKEILHRPLYFGQKDLSSVGEGFERDLVEKILGEKNVSLRSRVEERKQKIRELVETLNRFSDIAERRKELDARLRDATQRLAFYRESGIEERLQKQIDFETDGRTCAQVTETLKTCLGELNAFVRRQEGELEKHRNYVSKQNAPFFKSFFEVYEQIVGNFEKIRRALSDSTELAGALQEQTKGFVRIQEQFKEEFAVLERKITLDLQAQGIRSVQLEEFRAIRRTVDETEQALENLDREDSEYRALRTALENELEKLNALWFEEFEAIEAELDKIGGKYPSLKIRASFRTDRAAFLERMRQLFRDGDLRDSLLRNLAEVFPDFCLMYRGLEEAKAILGSSWNVFEKQFMKNLGDLLTWQVPNTFTIEHQGRELKQHSLGQRASALILFVLDRQDNDVIIIDQPEDDLDNQTIYEDVIKLVCSLKPKKQFIFATHNANIPVLGDAEKVFVCSCQEETIRVEGGSIDTPAIQQEIVSIMEGGEEAFQRRKGIYAIWKPESADDQPKG
ncbi:MAG: hypothetical protein LBR61_02280 [Synergistaceae bacterium]|jgi:energy-coupling factor transporter ATP-binding protein EcfA2|nr:hypothetical protein [Synergistaceae bacterium]